MAFALTTWYLESTSPADLRPARVPATELRIERAEIALPEFSRFLYTAVGGPWHWRDRLDWSPAQWLRWLDRPELQTWVLSLRGTPAGYVELERQADGAVELAYFGLVPRFTGQGLGGHLLTVGIQRAWALGANRVWVHTCNLDAPAALANYRARGLRVVREETVPRDDPGAPAGPWPGAR